MSFEPELGQQSRFTGCACLNPGPNNCWQRNLDFLCLNNLLYQPYLDLPSPPINLCVGLECVFVQDSVSALRVTWCSTDSIIVTLFSEATCFSWVFGDKFGILFQERDQIFISRFSVLHCACHLGPWLRPHLKGPTGELYQ